MTQNNNVNTPQISDAEFNKMVTGDATRAPTKEELDNYVKDEGVRSHYPTPVESGKFFNCTFPDSVGQTIDVSKISGPGEFGHDVVYRPTVLPTITVSVQEGDISIEVPSDEFTLIPDGGKVDGIAAAAANAAQALVEPHVNDVSNTTLGAEEILGLTSVMPSMPNPTQADLDDPVFNAIYNVIKDWDVGAPEFYRGYCGANGSHAKLILDALRALPQPEFAVATAAKQEEPAPSAVVDSDSYLVRFNDSVRRLEPVLGTVPDDLINRLSEHVDATFPIQMVLANDVQQLIVNPTVGLTYHETPEGLMTHILTLLEIRGHESYAGATADVKSQWEADVTKVADFVFGPSFGAPADSVDHVVFYEVAAALDMHSDMNGSAVQMNPESATYILNGARVMGERWLRYMADLKTIMPH